MGRFYSATFSGVAVSAQIDLFEITAPATAAIILHEVHITQDASEVSEMLPVLIRRVNPTATSGSGGTALTPAKLQPGDAASGATVESMNTTPAASSTTLEVINRLAENVLNGWHWTFAPELRPILPPSGMMVVRLAATPAAALTMSGELLFEEIG
jgi:hypothetical protein